MRLKVHERFPKIKKKSCLPSLATSCENMASNSERIMEISRNFQIVYVGCTDLCKHCITDHATGIMQLGISEPPHSPIAELSLLLEVGTISSAWRVQTVVKRVHVNSLNVEGTVFQTFYNYKQRSCIKSITNEQVKLISFIWEGVDFTLLILDVPLAISVRNVKLVSYFNIPGNLLSLWDVMSALNNRPLLYSPHTCGPFISMKLLTGHLDVNIW